MATYGKWSARAAQACAKCRKAHGQVRKTAAGANLKRWAAEKWKDKRTGAPCGGSKNSTEYCRPTKRVSSKTPVMPKGKALKAAIRSKISTGHAKTFKRRPRN
ncbi:MAG: hypothetical protein CL678_04110 [Bdellovibrionaceae bacterium]|nr:hypothetical protein [Pseudobdellovibrionaceae bacterium]